MFRDPSRVKRSLLAAHEDRRLISGRIECCATGTVIREFTGLRNREWYEDDLILEDASRLIGCSPEDLHALEAAFEGRRPENGWVRDATLDPLTRLDRALACVEQRAVSQTHAP